MNLNRFHEDTRPEPAIIAECEVCGRDIQEYEPYEDIDDLFTYKYRHEDCAPEGDEDI